MTNQLIFVIPSTMVDDFFIFGAIGGIFGFLYYWYTNRNNNKNHISFLVGFYGAFIWGGIGGLLAIVADRSIELAIIVGLFSQVIHTAILRSLKGAKFVEVIKDILIKYLTAGRG